MNKNNEKQQNGKKSVLLRLDSDMWEEIAAWADDEFRSINGQIEYILSKAVNQRKKSKNGDDKHVSQ
jgi:hypothetical protein